MIKNREKYDRLYVTPVIPYKVGSYDIDEEALRRLLRYFMQPKFVNAGGAIIINPVAGEIFFLSREEKKRVVKIAVEECNGKVPVFAGAIDWTTEGTVEVAKDAKEAGANGIFLIPPVGPSDITISWDSVKHPEIWIDMVKEIDRAVNMPMIGHPTVVEVPAWGRSLALEPTLKMCREIENIVGWKMTYNPENYKKIAHGLRTLDHHVAVLSAGAIHYEEFLRLGIFDGTAGGFWNYSMEPMVDAIEATKKGSDEGREAWPALKQLHIYINEDKTHHHLRYKIASWLRGLIPTPFMRPPMPRPNLEEIQILRGLLQAVNLDVISNDAVDNFLHESLPLPNKQRSRMVAV
jgi:4-hydroxy-tetrahydrodipicolinate synthase